MSVVCSGGVINVLQVKRSSSRRNSLIHLDNKEKYAYVIFIQQARAVPEKQTEASEGSSCGQSWMELKEVMMSV